MASGEWRVASQERLQAETFLRGVEHHDEIASTNDRALELCADASLPTPFLIITDRQTAGRGRGANRWWSSDGALLFSVIIDATAFSLPEFLWPQVSLTTGAAICEALGGITRESIGLKWPNDIWLNNRKVCGILVEVPVVQRGRLVIGVGLNVNNSFSDAPAELQTIATSLRDEVGSEFDRCAVLTALLCQLESDLRTLAANKLTLADRWRTLCVLRDRVVSLDTSQQVVTGRCLGITEDGALRLQTPSGERRFYAGVVRGIE